MRSTLRDAPCSRERKRSLKVKAFVYAAPASAHCLLHPSSITLTKRQTLRIVNNYKSLLATKTIILLIRQLSALVIVHKRKQSLFLLIYLHTLSRSRTLSLSESRVTCLLFLFCLLSHITTAVLVTSVLVNLFNKTIINLPTANIH